MHMRFERLPPINFQYFLPTETVVNIISSVLLSILYEAGSIYFTAEVFYIWVPHHEVSVKYFSLLFVFSTRELFNVKLNKYKHGLLFHG